MPESKPKVFVTSRLPSAALEPLQTGAFDVDYADVSEPLPRAELLARVRGAHGLVAQLTDKIDRELLDAAGDTLRVVSDVSVGYNNLDVQTLAARGVMATHTPDVLTDATADVTLGLILGIMRRLVEGDRLIRRNGWKGFGFTFMLGSDLRGKQLGIVGMGRIGQAVARRAAAFGMEIAYMPGTRQAEAIKAGQPPVFDGFRARPLPLEELLQSSDVVSLHVPLSDKTRHLIDRKALVRMKRSSYLINVARGPVVDEPALAWALKEGVISGAGLDVFEHEPEVYAELLTLENVMLVPHLGSATRETRTAMASLAVRNCVAVLSGEPPLTPIPELKPSAAPEADTAKA